MFIRCVGGIRKEVLRCSGCNCSGQVDGGFPSKAEVCMSKAFWMMDHYLASLRKP